MTGLRAALLFAGIALLLSTAASAAPAKTSDEAVLATKAALDAFFSMPAAQEAGVDATPPPPGFNGEEASQEELIRFLEQKRAQGARLDRYRWDGTLLHHSLRVSFNSVTQWLLDNGADPLQKLDPTPGADSLDALGVAVTLQRWGWVTSLLKHPAYQRSTAAERAARLWRGASGDAQINGLLRLRPAVPLPGAGTTAAQNLLRLALCSHQFALVERLAESAQAPALPAGADCSSDQLPAKPTALAAELPAWLALEARLDMPLLPWLLPSLRSPAELQAALASGLRQPWANAEFRRAMLFRAPEPALASLLLGPKPGLAVLWPDFGRRQGNQLWRRPAAEWAAVVKAAPALQELLDTAEANYSASLDARAGKPGAAAAWAQRWAPLVQRLDALTPADRRALKLPAGLLRQMPPQFLASGLAWGAEADALPEQFAQWLSGADLAELQAGWPLLKARSPELARQLLDALLVPLLVETPPGRMNRAMSNVGDDMLPKARWLRAQGLTAPGRELAVANLPQGDNGGPCCSRALVAWALSEKLVRSPVPPVPPRPDGKSAMAAKPAALRLIAAEPACKPVVSVGLRRALTQPIDKVADRGDMQYDDVSFQPLAAPGRAECVWLRNEIAHVGGSSWEEFDFFEGVRRFNPCGDGAGRLSVWDESQQAFVTLSDGGPVGALIETELMPGGPLWLSAEINNGRCGNPVAMAQLLSWKSGRPDFEPMPNNDPRQLQWQTACPADHLSVCLKLETEDGSPPPPAPPRVPLGPEQFVARHWPAERVDFLAAFDRLDRPRLDGHQRDGLFPEWLNAAAHSLATSPRPLAEKRARMAWLLAKPARAATLSDTTLDSLLAWLPAEDWRPVIEPRRCSGDFGPRWGLQRMIEKAPPDVGRRIALALATDCNGVVR